LLSFEEMSAPSLALTTSVAARHNFDGELKGNPNPVRRVKVAPASLDLSG
jgi:hypothetical protein